jgi:nucleoside-diphosphate-sugar epimerase
MITGAAGYIGTHLVNHIREHTNWKIIQVDRKWGWGDLDNDEYPLNLSSFDKFRQDAFKDIIHDMDIIYHLAGKTPKVTEGDYWRDNVAALYTMLEYSGAYQPLIYTSSLAVHRDWYHPYAWSKKVAEKVFDCFAGPHAIVRLANVWGRGSKSVIDTWIRRLIHEKDIQVDMNQFRDFVHVLDVVDCLLFLGKYMMNRKDWYRKEVFELGIGVSANIKSIANLLHMGMESKATMNYIDKEYSASKADIRELSYLGWEPKRYPVVPTLADEATYYEELMI